MWNMQKVIWSIVQLQKWWPKQHFYEPYSHLLKFTLFKIVVNWLIDLLIYLKCVQYQFDMVATAVLWNSSFFGSLFIDQWFSQHDFFQRDELRSVRKDLLKLQKSETELGEELDNCHMLLTSKEADCTRLARDLGASQVREAQKEAKFNQEIHQIKQQFQFRFQQTDQEVCMVGWYFWC